MKEKILQFETRKDIFWVSLGLIGLCACMYVYFITTAVRNVVSQRQVSAQASNLSEKISVKEFNFISVKNKVTMQYAQSLGFSEAKNKVFITPTSVSYVSGPNNSAI